MLHSIISSLKPGNDSHDTRRRHPRRDVDRCVAVIHGRTFPVKNWSLGGVLLTADDRMFGKEQDIEIMIKFKLRNTIIDVKHRGHVVRKGNQSVAIEFEPLDVVIRRKFQQVIDDYVAGEFASSQSPA